MYRIMIIEDDKGIAQAISKQTSMWNIESVCVNDFRNIMGELAECKPHLVLLDISLPFYNGYYWCEEIRKVSKVPIIFLSSASDNMNIVMAMNMGGDDFIAKPFDMGVLIAKIQAVLRRTYDFTASVSIIEHKGLILNTENNTLTYKGENIDLTKNEYRIIHVLMTNRDKVVSREKLMEKLWESDSFVDENTLTVNVNRLRKKLDAIGAKNMIATKHGIGYILQSESNKQE
ncbi:MAG: response regulator transcription factor [Lachnoclostridium sp.]|nr:response regulator transcription factor [Lachnoclostridium sp.]